jgi:coenzyme PQQ precursor peptide PqqA
MSTSGSALMHPWSLAQTEHSVWNHSEKLEHRHAGSYGDDRKPDEWEAVMLWSKPKLVEICVGLEINAYYPAEL